MTSGAACFTAETAPLTTRRHRLASNAERPTGEIRSVQECAGIFTGSAPWWWFAV